MKIAAIRMVARASCLVAIVLACAGARAEGRALEPLQGPPLVNVLGECPASSRLSLALAPVLRIAATSAPAVLPRVTDLGDRFEVAVAGQVGLYTDANRDCDERARIAAVFIALVLTPPMIPLSAAPEMPPSVTKQLVTEAPAGRWLAMSLAARCDGAASRGTAAAIGIGCGGELGGSIGWGDRAAFASAAVLTSTVSTFGSVAVRVQRFPLAAGATIGRDLRARWRVAAEVGAALALLRIQGLGLDAGGPVLRFDAGARAGVALLLPPVGQAWVPLIAMHVEYFPRAYQLDVDPLGTIGALSRLSVGASVGVSYRGSRRERPTSYR